jgi:hypothetical protein
MMSSTNSAEQRYYIFVSWASRENPQVRMKAQGHSSIEKAKKAHQVLTYLTDKFIALTWMGVGHQKIRRKTLGLHGQKVREGYMIQEEIIVKLAVAMQIEVVAGVECKTGPSTACYTKETPTIGREIVPFSWNPKRKWPKSIANHGHQAQPKKLTTHPIGTNHHNHLPQINPHIKISTLTQNTNPTTTDSPSSITSHITTYHTQASPHTSIDNHLPYDTLTNNVPRRRLSGSLA